jgi:hypothetical protein
MEGLRVRKMGGKGGRPPFDPTPHRRSIEMMAACGIPAEKMALAVRCSLPTLRKHFRFELDNGMTNANRIVGESLFFSRPPAER